MSGEQNRSVVDLHNQDNDTQSISHRYEFLVNVLTLGSECSSWPHQWRSAAMKMLAWAQSCEQLWLNGHPIEPSQKFVVGIMEEFLDTLRWDIDQANSGQRRPG